MMTNFMLSIFTTTLAMICISLVPVIARADYNDEIATINKGMPNVIQRFNLRVIECNHWGGEEPYDKARLKEINAAVKTLKCDALQKDEQLLRKKYKLHTDILESMNKAKAFI
jgi:hypothetical protein